jgi:hypothetical protein
MPRIRTDQPSSGRPLRLVYPSNGFVPDTWTTIVEAPDFSVPGTGDTGVTLDPADPDRELRPGEVFFETPLTVVNLGSVTRWIEVRLVTQNNTIHPLTPNQLKVPANEAIYVPIQGLRLLKTNFTAIEGDALQMRASTGSSIKIIGSAVELEALTHAPDSEA